MDEHAWQIVEGDGPLVAAAIHSGHAVRDEVAELLALEEHERLREQDPFTDAWTSIAANRVLGRRSRFEVDLNRPREKAVYLSPEDAWGLSVWKSTPSPAIIESSLAIYDQFYEELYRHLTLLVERYGRVVIYDLHSYNHRRRGPDEPHDDPELHPEVNVGTGTMARTSWAPLVDRFLADLRRFEPESGSPVLPNRPLDVRENVKFSGGHFPRWIHQQFPERVCVLSIEVKKFFMDEWTGRPDVQLVEMMGAALQSTVGGVLEELEKL